jgi:hypothetical protein
MKIVIVPPVVSATSVIQILERSPSLFFCSDDFFPPSPKNIYLRNYGLNALLCMSTKFPLYMHGASRNACALRDDQLITKKHAVRATAGVWVKETRTAGQTEFTVYCHRPHQFFDSE